VAPQVQPGAHCNIPCPAPHSGGARNVKEYQKLRDNKSCEAGLQPAGCAGVLVCGCAVVGANVDSYDDNDHGEGRSNTSRI
jgi:hypothetical protein